MADQPSKEVRWSCGCHEVDGKLEVECTQSQHQGEMSAERHATARPFSAKCFRLAAELAEEQRVAEALQLLDSQRQQGDPDAQNQAEADTQKSADATTDPE